MIDEIPPRYSTATATGADDTLRPAADRTGLAIEAREQ
jgi:hypothetical protein